jgi:hypothetical protein
VRGETAGRAPEVKFMNTRAAKLTLFLLAVLAVVGAHSSAYGQSEDRDRPDSVGGSRSIGGKDDAAPQRGTRTADEPEVVIERELRVTPRTANVNKLRTLSRMTMLGVTAVGGPESAYATALDKAREDYAGKFKTKLADASYKRSHVALRLEDFARAYIMTLNPEVAKHISDFDLAELRSMVLVYDSYEEILRAKVPELTEAQVKSLTKEAKAAVKAGLSK